MSEANALVKKQKGKVREKGKQYYRQFSSGSGSHGFDLGSMGGGIKAAAPRQWGNHSSLRVHLSEIGSWESSHLGAAEVGDHQFCRGDHRHDFLLLLGGSKGSGGPSRGRRPNFGDSQHG